MPKCCARAASWFLGTSDAQRCSREYLCLGCLGGKIEEMTTFCLIHGSGQGPNGWKLLVDELEQREHNVLTPAFHLDRTDVGAAWHADTIVEALKNVPSSYIVCAEDRTITPAWQRRAAREWLGVEPVELPGEHAPHVSRPEVLAEVLESISE
jgi:alpha/beta hydrolase family protein